MKLAHAARIKPATKLSCDSRAHELAGLRPVVQAIEQTFHPVRNIGAAQVAHPLNRSKAHHRHDAWYDLAINASCNGFVSEFKETARVEEKLRNCAGGARIKLGFEVVEIALSIRAFGVHLRIGSDGNLEFGNVFEARDQLDGIGIAAGMRRVLAVSFRGITAQCDNVPNAAIPIMPSNVVHFLLGRRHAGEVRCSRNTGLVLDANDLFVRALPR